MEPTDVLGPESPNVRRNPKQIASWGHLAGFLAIQAGFVAMGLLDQGDTLGGNDAKTAGVLASLSVVIHIVIYITMIAMECGLLLYCWVGVRRRGGNLETLSGGRWTSWKGILADLGIAVPFWLFWQGLSWAFSRLLGPESVDSVTSLLPQKLPEVLVWIVVSISAGVCEELAFRGYLQQQLHALGGSLAVAVLGQGLVFGLAHSYQGWRSTIVIVAIGILLGALAAWRRNLRANMIVHTWVDVWEGWLKFVAFR